MQLFCRSSSYLSKVQILDALLKARAQGLPEGDVNTLEA